MNSFIFLALMFGLIFQLCLPAIAQTEQDCTPINLAIRGSMGVPRAQGKTQWCFAHTLADMMTSKIGKPISAADIAMTYNIAHSVEAWGEPILSSSLDSKSGSVRKAFEATSKDGFCLNSEFKVDDLGHKPLYESLVELEYELSGKNSKNKRLTKKRKDELFRMIRPLFPKVTFKEFLANYKPKTSESPLYDLRNYACRNRIKTDVGFSRVKPKSPEEMANVINQSLKMHQAVGYGGAMNCFEDKNSKPNLELGGHAVSIVGRKWVNNSCRYIIRNSYHPEWNNTENSTMDAKRLFECMGEVYKLGPSDATPTQERPGQNPSPATSTVR